MQPQGHAQLMIRIFEYNQNPQAALDSPRWRISQDMEVYLESGFSKELFTGLAQLGHRISLKNYTAFGGGQIIYKLNDSYLGASDWRKDGNAVGF